MKKLEITNQKLMSADAEIQGIASTGVGLLLSGPIEDFYKKNLGKINLIREKIKGIQTKHVVFEDGKMKFPERKEGDTSKVVPVFKLGSSEEQVQKEYEALMAEMVTIEV